MLFHSIIPKISFVFLLLIPLNASASDAGKIDTVFGQDGFVSANPGDPFSGSARVDMSIQVDGKVVVLGRGDESNFALARYTVNGDLDTSFGNNGVVYSDFEGMVEEVAKEMVIQGDGKIVVAGLARDASNNAFLPVIARYNIDGTLDTSFGNFGQGIIRGELSDFYIQDIAVQGDGKLVTVGYHPTLAHWNIRKYEANGSRDHSFGNGLGGGISIPIGGAHSEHVIIQPDGKVIVIGWFNNDTKYGVVLARYNTDGSLDANFGDSGVATYKLYNEPPYPLFKDLIVLKAELQKNGKIVIGGRVFGHNLISNYAEIFVLKFLANGALDHNFWSAEPYILMTPNTTGGMLSIKFQADADANYISGLTVDVNNRIIVAGSTSLDKTALARLLPDGKLDDSFDDNGVSILNYDLSARNLALRFDRFYATVGANFSVARFVASGTIGVGKIQQYITSISCPEDLSVNNGANVCGASVNYSQPTTSDPATVNCTTEPGSFFLQGDTHVTCTSVVGDGSQNQQRVASCSFNVNVVDTEAPNLECPDITVSTDSGLCSAKPVLPVTSNDNCSDSLTPSINPTPGSIYSLGYTQYSAMVTDSAENKSSCLGSVTVNDTDDPQISMTVAETRLTPPNHKMQDVGLSLQINDNCTSGISTTVTVFSNETNKLEHKRNSGPDAVFSNGTLLLRKERNGTGTGRVYLIAVSTTDHSGNSSIAAQTVVVPFDRAVSDNTDIEASNVLSQFLDNEGQAPIGYQEIISVPF